VRGLRDAGHEVVVAAEATPEAIAAAALQEDVDVVVVADGAAATSAALEAAGLDDVRVHTLSSGATADSIVDHLT